MASPNPDKLYDLFFVLLGFHNGEKDVCATESGTGKRLMDGWYYLLQDDVDGCGPYPSREDADILAQEHVQDRNEVLYTPDQHKAAEYIVRLSGGDVGGGEDPVGFLIASHNSLNETRKDLVTKLESSNEEVKRIRACYVADVGLVNKQKDQLGDQLRQAEKHIERYRKEIEGPGGWAYTNKKLEKQVQELRDGIFQLNAVLDGQKVNFDGD